MHHQFFSGTHLPEVNKAIGDFVSAELFGKPGRFDKYCSMGVFDEGLLCGVLYHNYMPEFGTINMSAASHTRRWLSKTILREMLSMPFEVLGCKAIIACHEESAMHLRRMWTSVGGDETIIPNKRGDRPEVVSVLTKEAWRASPHARVREMAHG